MAYQTVIMEVCDNHVGTITLNRPEQLNAFTTRMAFYTAEDMDYHKAFDHMHDAP